MEILWKGIVVEIYAAVWTLLKKETLAHVFSCEFCEIFKNAYFIKILWATFEISPCKHNDTLKLVQLLAFSNTLPNNWSNGNTTENGRM